MVNIIGFFKDNHQKRVTLAVWCYAAIFRSAILYIPMSRLKKYLGAEGQESPEDAEPSEYKYAKLISKQVNRSANNTPWESKCLVRALTARKMLIKKGISSTLYLGVSTEDGKMIAHAWLRVGKMYVTGGNGEGYSIVAKYKV